MSLRSYHFDIGNITDGPLGLCARVQAESEAAAVDILRIALPDLVEIKTADKQIEYITIYLNVKPRTCDIDDSEAVAE